MVKSNGRTFKYDELPIGTLLRDVELGLRYRLIREGDGVIVGYLHREETAAEIVAALNTVAEAAV